GIPLPSSHSGETANVPAIPTPLLPPPPRVRIDVLDVNGNTLVLPPDLGDAGRGIPLPPDNSRRPVFIPIPPEAAAQMVTAGKFYISLSTPSRGTQLSIRRPGQGYVPAVLRRLDASTGQILGDIPPRAPDGEPRILFHGREGTFG